MPLSSSPTPPLAGVRVLDLSRVLAGPWCTQTLGDLGADVIKVERPGTGDDSRQYGPPFIKEGANKSQSSAMYLCANRNKRSIEVDLNSTRGQEIIRALVTESDVLVENFKVGDLARRGLDYESLKACNSGLIYCSVSGYGQDGPYARQAATDPILQAMCGMMSITGHPEDAPGGSPMKTGANLIDISAGLYATIAILGALYARKCNNGEGQHIDISLLDTGVSLIAQQATHFFMSGLVPQRFGTESSGGAPTGVFSCSDGDIMIVPSNQSLYERLVEILGLEELATDPRFSSIAQRVQHRSILVPILRSSIAKWKTHDLLSALQAAEVPAAPINTIDRTFQDPQVRHREMAQKLRLNSGENITLVANPIRYSTTPLRAAQPPPLLGEHTEEIVTSLRLSSSPQ